MEKEILKIAIKNAVKEVLNGNGEYKYAKEPFERNGKWVVKYEGGEKSFDNEMVAISYKIQYDNEVTKANERLRRRDYH